MTHKEFLKLYWKQYISLEKDLLNMGDYIAIDSKNNPCFSNNFAKIYMMACSELDSLADIFATEIKGKNNIEKQVPKTFPWRVDMILEEIKNLHEMRVKTVESMEVFNFVPFKGFNENEADEWWKDYNLVKHNRTEMNSGGKYNYEKANLKNTMTALAALYLMCCLMSKFIDKDATLTPESNLFVLC